MWADLDADACTCEKAVDGVVNPLETDFTSK